MKSMIYHLIAIGILGIQIGCGSDHSPSTSPDSNSSEPKQTQKAETRDDKSIQSSDSPKSSYTGKGKHSGLSYLNTRNSEGLIQMDRSDTKVHSWMKYVGKLIYQTSQRRGVCTAQVVGRDLIVTAGHCMTTYNSDLPNFTFWLGAIDLDPSGVLSFGVKEVVFTGGGSDETQSENDWAIVRLDGSLPDGFGQLRVEVINTDEWIKSEGDLMMIGYPLSGGRRGNFLYVDPQCKMIDKSQDARIEIRNFRGVAHNCAAAEGFSGGALLHNFGTNEQPDWRLLGLISGALYNTFFLTPSSSFAGKL